MNETAVHPSKAREQAKDARADELLDAERENGKSPELVVEALSLPQKLLKVAGEIPEIDKDGHNERQNYDYASAENMLRKVREPLAAAGLLLLSDLVSIEVRDGKSSPVTTVTLQFTFIDTEGTATLETTWAGTGADPSDKGLSKAYTAAVKTFLRMTFLLPLGDDPEADSRADDAPAFDPVKTLSEKAVEKLEQAIAEAGIDAKHVEAKLRGFGVDSLAALNNEQGVAMFGWVGEAKLPKAKVPDGA